MAGQARPMKGSRNETTAIPGRAGILSAWIWHIRTAGGRMADIGGARSADPYADWTRLIEPMDG